jgi:beta-N-acetylhexosaminidase
LAAADASGEHGWVPSADSEQRRLALLPQTEPLPWDDLMLDAAYQRALALLP